MQDRFMVFDGVHNFRDFGGYATGLGRIKRGRLFRSAHFAQASPSDIARLDALGCAFLVDLRRPVERARQPNRWPGPNVMTHASNSGNEAAEPPHIAFLRSDDLSVAGVDVFMRGIYREMPFTPEHIGLFRAFFEGAMAGKGAGIVHCAAGKDRTGLLCALVLTALGASEDDVLADYERTNHSPQFETRLAAFHRDLEARLARQVDIKALRPFAGVSADWLKDAFAQIRARHGSIEGYLENALGLGPDWRDPLAAALIE